MKANNIHRHTAVMPKATAANISKRIFFSFTGTPHSDPDYEFVLLHGFQCAAEDEIEACSQLSQLLGLALQMFFAFTGD